MLFTTDNESKNSLAKGSKLHFLNRLFSAPANIPTMSIIIWCVLSSPSSLDTTRYNKNKHIINIIYKIVFVYLFLKPLLNTRQIMLPTASVCQQTMGELVSRMKHVILPATYNVSEWHQKQTQIVVGFSCVLLKKNINKAICGCPKSHLPVRTQVPTPAAKWNLLELTSVV